MITTNAFNSRVGWPSNGQRIGTTLTAVLALLILTGRCTGQGTMQIGFEGPPALAPGTWLPIHEYYESDVWFRVPYGPPGNLARIGPGLSGYADDGTAWLSTLHGTTLVFSFTNGTPFSLLSLDVANANLYNPYPIPLQVVGYRYDGGLLTNSFTISSLASRRANQLPDFERFDLDPGFADLARVEIGGGFALDNVVLGIPEPGPSALLAIGAVLGALRHSRRKAQWPRPGPTGMSGA